jgi:hypothetical protein
MPPTTSAKSPPPPEPDREFRGPPEEEFWERYNARLEFPLGTAAAILLHVVVAAILVVVFVRLMDKGGDKSGVPVKLIDVGGMDDAGEGSAGSGGQDDPLRTGDNQFKAMNDALPTPEALAEAKARLSITLDDPAGTTPIAASNAAAFTKSSDELLQKILGSRKGSGGGAGTGFDGSKGSGPGGTGADSSRARSLRWVLRFRTNDGRDYLAQLAAMRAEILVPLPPENRQCLYFPDLNNPANKKTATDDDLRMLADRIKFSDTRPASVAGVCDALGVREPARSFWAFFPKGLEDDLSRLETGFRNRRAEDIEETVFRVTVRGGKTEMVVDSQTAKR